MVQARDLVSHREALRRRVCSICLDGDDEGRCALPEPGSCPMEDRIEVLVDAVLDLSRCGGTPHGSAIETRVCCSCRHRDALGGCRLRDQGRCAVAVFLPLIVEALQHSR